MENSSGKQNGIIWGLWVGLSVMGGVSVYYYPLFVLTMFVVPAVWAAMAFRTHPSMLFVVGALVFLFGFLMGYGLMDSLCIVGLVMPAGCFLWFAQKERMGNFQSVIFVSVLLAFGLFLIFCVPDLVNSGDPYASIRSYFAAVPEMFSGTALEQAARLLVSRIDEMIVACFYAFAGAYALVNVLVLHAFNKRKQDMPLCPMGPFGTWFAPYGYVMASGAAGLLATLISFASDSRMVSTLSLLMYEMWALPLFVTGANYLFLILSRRLSNGRGKMIFGLLMVAGLLLTPQFAQMILMLAGLIGVMRRRRAGKEQR